MTKPAGFYKKDWFVALLIGAVFALAVLGGARSLQRLELLVYDSGVRMTSRTPGATENIAIIAIDDPSIKEIGRWPWPRSVLAEMLDWLARAEAKAIGLLIFFTEPQNDPGLTHIRSLQEYLDANPLPPKARVPEQLKQVRQMLRDAERELDVDRQLGAAIPRARSVYLPMFFELGRPLGNPESALPDYVRRNRLTNVVTRDGGSAVESTLAAHAPLEVFGQKAAGIGHLNLGRESNEGVRTENLVLEHFGEHYPSLAMLLAARSLNLGPEDIQIELGRGVRTGRLAIRTSKRLQMYTGFYPATREGSAFARYSFHDVLAGKVPAGVFRNRIVLIGSTAVGVGNVYGTPLGPMSGPELTGNVVASILNQDFYQRPRWAMAAEWALLAAVLLYLMLGIPNLPARIAAPISAVLLLALLVSGHYLLVSEKMWLKTATPALFLLVGHMLITTKRFLLTERLKHEAETDSAHNNRMLGLAFQGQGQLDMAYDKFLRLAVDGSVLELFYNLALDFERKRRFSKAASCYDYILRHDAKFRDAAMRKQRAAVAEHTVMLGGKATSAGGTLVLDTTEKPRLGRYEVERELGRGAMGAVYLGRDPRINRIVAIKTIELSQFEDSELEQVRSRFFREAETAGRLNHPNIVTIYDAGEEHDLAYIAMELLQGNDLTHYLRQDRALPLDWVSDVVAQVADALDYAHRNDVVHRDIKPANIMYDEAAKKVKVTDFGIARVTASSRTKTGVVLGTPSYMSPEQLSGKHVDGRSDLFSLGVTLFELLTRQQPFGGDSLATLMYRIANDKHPDVTELRPDLPACVKKVIDKALAKSADKRFQTGAEMRQALLECAGMPSRDGGKP
jgi:serine/threonine-protein kinase